MTEDTSSPIVIDSIAQESSQHWENLRSDLKDLKKRMKISEAEMAVGLRIGRQATNQFINGTKDTLPVDRKNLMWLLEHISSEDSIKKLNSEDAKVNRRKLKDDDANNILERSGFLGIERQLIIKDDLSTSEKFHRLIFRLSNKALSARDIWNVEEAVINQISQLSLDSKESNSFGKIHEIRKWLELRHENVDIYWKDIESTLERYKSLGRKSFTETEVIELFQSITENKMLRKSKDQNIRVLHYETRTFNSVYRRLLNPASSKEHDPTISKVLGEILEEGVSIENTLRELKEDKKGGKLLFNPMNEVKLNCKLGNEEIFWFYRSCSSSTDNMISAIQRGMAHNLELKDLSSHVLAEGSDSIVRVSAILKSEDSFYTGRWVDIDMILSFAQAIVIAAEDWIKDKITSKEVYYDVCIRFAKTIERIDALTGKTYEYGLTHKSDGDVSQKNYPVAAFEEWIEEVDNISNISLHEDSVPYSLYESILKRNKRQAQLAQSRYYHVVGNVEKAKSIIADIKDGIKKEREEKDFFDPTIILFEVESMMSKFYTSDGEFFDNKLWGKKLEAIEVEIKKYLRAGKGVSLLTDSLYHTLAELYGNIGRFDFYNCGGEKFNLGRLELALKYSQRAAYFAMKTDDEKRASHWLARCSRILCRIDRSEEANNYINAARRILKRSISEHQYRERSKALELEINIATGELHLLRNEPAKAVDFFANALEGAIHLQFARIMAGSLYGLYRASQDDIQPVIKKLTIFNKQTEKESEQIENTKTATVSIKDECMFVATKEFLKNASKYTTDNEKKALRGELKERAIDIWNSWAKLSGDNTSHFISKHMIEDTFLSVIKNSEYSLLDK